MQKWFLGDLLLFSLILNNFLLHFFYFSSLKVNECSLWANRNICLIEWILQFDMIKRWANFRMCGVCLYVGNKASKCTFSYINYFSCLCFFLPLCHSQELQLLMRANCQNLVLPLYVMCITSDVRNVSDSCINGNFARLEHCWFHNMSEKNLGKDFF